MNYGMSKTAKHLRLAAPRGFCAGVDRAVKIVEAALDKFGSPVYVRHEIVHNKTVVNELADKGAIFVEELHEVPVGAPVVLTESSGKIGKELKRKILKTATLYKAESKTKKE